jgi:hypothetical protein
MRSRVLRVSAGVMVLLALVAVTGFAEYDRAKVRSVMDANQTALFALNRAANGGRYMEAAGYLLTISQGMYTIKDFTPLRGDKAAWDQTMTDFLKATWRGLAACGDENQANLKAAVGDIQRLMQVGHNSFR